MKLREFLFERITISPSELNRLIILIKNWVTYIQKNKTYEFAKIKSQYQEFIDLLASELTPVVTDIVASQVEKNIRVDVSIFPAIPNEDAEVAATVNDQWDQNGDIWTNELKIRLTFNDFKNIQKSMQDDYTQHVVKTLAMLISHEVTHLIQTAKRSNNAGIKSYAVPSKYFGATTQYFGSAEEIDAYAQSFVTDVVMSGKTREAVKFLKQGGKLIDFEDFDNFTTFLDEFQPMSNYQSIKFIITDIKNAKTARIKTQIWRRFLKKIYEKLHDYSANNVDSSTN